MELVQWFFVLASLIFLIALGVTSAFIPTATDKGC